MFGPTLAADGSASLSVVGAGTFKVFKVADPAGLKPMTAALGRHSSQNFTCHLWLIDGGPCAAFCSLACFCFDPLGYQVVSVCRPG